MAIDYSVLYREFEGTLTPAEDPSNNGSQASVYGYLAGGGTTLDEKWREFTKIQENGSGRPITVQIRATQGPGKVQDALFAQVFQDAIDLNEYHTARQIADTQVESTDLEMVRQRFLTADPDALFVVTTELESQLNRIFDNANWPVTRANLFAAIERAGSRSEEMFGQQVSRDDVQQAEQWRAINQPGSPSLYT